MVRILFGALALAFAVPAGLAMAGETVTRPAQARPQGAMGSVIQAQAGTAAAPATVPPEGVPGGISGGIPGGVLVGPRGGAMRLLTPEALARLPQLRVELPGHASAANAPPPAPVVLEGPSLWSVLAEAGAVNPAQPREQVRRVVLATGRDGYVAVLALGEIAPDFAGRPVLLALRMDGRALDPVALRLAVPGEVRGGRSVRDLARLEILEPGDGPPGAPHGGIGRH
ncbi:hypothetical protein MVG78_01195 [Roseomonas gilardii subsp. gilardii]|uniref:hypothetical protein n=1 Tax=Roseomonas gilardii TaxID=257708 RepID=UPI001FF8599F|nr:hypothetical protein [Roseomonas gilardii]UPG72843.1 hypothetical protein MVG78_01195 [Roseomonas gilardii subsp. gilardii]